MVEWWKGAEIHGLSWRMSLTFVWQRRPRRFFRCAERFAASAEPASGQAQAPTVFGICREGKGRVIVRLQTRLEDVSVTSLA